VRRERGQSLEQHVADVQAVRAVGAGVVAGEQVGTLLPDQLRHAGLAHVLAAERGARAASPFMPESA